MILAYHNIARICYTTGNIFARASLPSLGSGHRVEAQLDARIVALDYASEAATVDAALVTDVARLMKLGSAALFVRESGAARFVREIEVGWDPGDVRTIPGEGFLVRSLIATEQSAVLDSR